jgi:hypothetical protein
MKKFLLLLVLTGCNCGHNDHLDHARDARCDTSCYSGPASTENIGNCHNGTWSCDADGNITTCDGEVLPQPEDCSGRDLNCDGDPYDVPLKSCYTGPSATENVGACHGGYVACQQCTFETTPQPEQCGYDLNCNGIIGDIPPAPCYDGPPGTVSLPGCHYGYQACQGTTTVCMNEAYPTKYINYDVVFIMTTDGSMISPYPQIIADVTQWCQSNPSSSCALLLAPDSNIDNGGVDGGRIILQNNLNTSTLSTALSSISFQPVYWAGDVGIWDAIYDACDISNVDPNNPIKLNWHPGNKPVVVFFTDEEPQSLPINYTPTLIEQQLMARCAGIDMIAFLIPIRDAQPFQYASLTSNIYDSNVGFGAVLSMLLPPLACQ